MDASAITSPATGRKRRLPATAFTSDPAAFEEPKVERISSPVSLNGRVSAHHKALLLTDLGAS
jgi:hypothetical protein